MSNDGGGGSGRGERERLSLHVMQVVINGLKGMRNLGYISDLYHATCED